MNSTLPSAESSKTWWSLSRSSSSKDLRQKYVQDSHPQRPVLQLKSTGKFNSFASAIGFKPKKSPSLAIQEPPLPIPTNNNVVTLTNNVRPTSKSASSTRSRVDSIEPRTPIDSHRDHRHSLLTLSDDPFAGRPMIAVPVPHLPSDPNRLSAYSNPSVTDLVQKKAGDPTAFNRISYASSSSNSNNHTLDVPPATPPVSKGRQEFRQLHNKRSVGSIQFQRSQPPLQSQASLIPATSSEYRSRSSSKTGYDSHSMQMMDAPERPKLRARGMTESDASHPAGFFVEEKANSRKLSQRSPTSSHIPPSPEIPGSPWRPNSPKVVIRQASVNHLQRPPSAPPPTQRLPPPPPPPPPPSQQIHNPSQRKNKSGSSNHVESPSSSSMSFSSAISLTNDMFANPPFAYVDDDKRRSGRSLFSQDTYDELEISMFERESRTTPSSPRTLKKAISQQSLARLLPSSPPPPTPKTPLHAPPEKVFRKQRSFHHPRLPVPPVPLPPTASTSAGPSVAAFPTTEPPHSVLQRRRTSTASSTGRKRLFSNSSQHRPSTAQPTSTTDDDTFSLFSLRSEAESHVTPYKSWFVSKPNPSTSFWDEGVSEHQPLSPARSNIEYTPQAIMSKAELAKLEASVENSPLRPGRNRGFSTLSASTMASEADNDSAIIPIGLSPPPPSRPNTKQISVRMSNSSSKMPSAPMPQRPHSSPHSIMSEQGEQDDGRSQSTSLATMRPRSPPAMLSLPPPPRRQRSTLISEPQIPEATRPRPVKQKINAMRMSTVEKAMHRRSIMRKSSFLDIDDETDRETEPECIDSERITGSFLDLARESFDTTRSGD